LDQSEPTEEVSNLTEVVSGRWQVWTRDSVHILDLDGGTVPRLPGSDATSGFYDSHPSILRHIYFCRVGSPGFWTLEADWRAPSFEYVRQLTIVIRKIDRVKSPDP
jgi:hypothetical protein